MTVKRHIDPDKKEISIEFSKGFTFGPIELNPTTDILTKMIASLEGRVTSLEEKVGK